MKLVMGTKAGAKTFDFSDLSLASLKRDYGEGSPIVLAMEDVVVSAVVSAISKRPLGEWRTAWEAYARTSPVLGRRVVAALQDAAAAIAMPALVSGFEEEEV